MANFGAKILGNAVGALTAQQAVIATTSNNIANVNTPGYSRRTLNLEARGSSSGSGVQVGNGVEIGSITRHADSYLERLLREAIGQREKSGTDVEYLDRMQSLFDISGKTPTIGSRFTEFYTALNLLTTNPSSIELRSNLIAAGEDLVTSITQTYNTIASLQTEADQRVQSEVTTINTLTSQIAVLNTKIVAGESTGNVAGDERDKRDLLLQQLSEKIGVQLVEVSDGSVNVTLSNGFALVSGGNSRQLETTYTPSFGTAPYPPSLGGGVLSYVVYDFNSGAGTSHIDLTSMLQQGGGAVGSLLELRGYSPTTATSAFSANGVLVDMAARVEAIARTLLTTVNQQYLGADENTADPDLDPSSGDLDGDAPSVYGLFDFTYGGTKDIDPDGAGALLPNGLPDDLGQHGIDNYASILVFGVSNPRDIAAALDTNATMGARAFADGDGRNLENLAARLLQPFNFSVGSVSETATMSAFYDQTVGQVGNLMAAAELTQKVAESNAISAQARRDEFSAVSLDEEFTSLIRFQKAYEASARMIRVADELLEQVLALI
jgi:flagellar hook-associated protein 1 FlgK